MAPALVLPALAGCASEPPSVDAAPAAETPTRLGLVLPPGVDADTSGRLASLFADSGLRGARTRCEDASWKAMQADAAAPVDFTRLDALISAHQAAGLVDLSVCLDTGIERPGRRGQLGARGLVPAPEALAAYAEWVGAVVERYDGDGFEDMPGLVAPVDHYEVGLAFSRRPGAGIEPYLLLLERAHRAAHAAHAGVVVAHAALLVVAAPEEEVPPRLGVLGADARRRLLGMTRRYDAINLQVIGDAVALDETLAELESEQRKRGARKPVLVSYLAPSPLIAWGKATSCEGPAGALGVMVAPAAETHRCALAEHFRRLVSDSAGALAWVWRFAAADLVRKSVVAASHGVSRVYAGPAIDAAWWQASDFQAAAGLTAWAGLVDVDTRRARPARSALEQLARVLDGRDRVERVDMGRTDVRLYAVSGEEGTLWIAWHEGVGLALQGEAAPEVEIEFDLGGGGLTLTHMAGLEAEPSAQTLSAGADRRVRIPLAAEPIYLTPLPSQARRNR